MKKKLPIINPSNNDKKATEYFSKLIDLITAKADKGRTTVILDLGDYIAKVNRQPSNNLFYVVVIARCRVQYGKYFLSFSYFVTS